jgi:hypothetical protein
MAEFWANRYWNGRYFASRYFGGETEAGGPAYLDCAAEIGGEASIDATAEVIGGNVEQPDGGGGWGFGPPIPILPRKIKRKKPVYLDCAAIITGDCTVEASAKGDLRAGAEISASSDLIAASETVETHISTDNAFWLMAA